MEMPSSSGSGSGEVAKHLSQFSGDSDRGPGSQPGSDEDSDVFEEVSAWLLGTKVCEHIRECWLCGMHPKSPDPLDIPSYLKWSHYTLKEKAGKPLRISPCGVLCCYCQAVKNQGPYDVYKLEDLRAEIVANEFARATFMADRAAYIQYLAIARDVPKKKKRRRVEEAASENGSE